jgi:hypothetical protein
MLSIERDDVTLAIIQSLNAQRVEIGAEPAIYYFFC